MVATVERQVASAFFVWVVLWSRGLNQFSSQQGSSVGMGRASGDD